MKVKVGDKTYDANTEPIMIILSLDEKEQISNMAPDATKYCVYPNTDEWTRNNYEKIKAWMEYK